MKHYRVMNRDGRFTAQYRPYDFSREYVNCGTPARRSFTVAVMDAKDFHFGLTGMQPMREVLEDREAQFYMEMVCATRKQPHGTVKAQVLGDNQEGIDDEP